MSACRLWEILLVGGDCLFCGLNGADDCAEFCLNARREPASPFHLLKCCRVKQVQFAVTQVLDGSTQVLRQNMPLRCGHRLRE